jgi:hypothetical protein
LEKMFENMRKADSMKTITIKIVWNFIILSNDFLI